MEDKLLKIDRQLITEVENIIDRAIDSWQKGQCSLNIPENQLNKKAQKLAIGISKFSMDEFGIKIANSNKKVFELCLHLVKHGMVLPADKAKTIWLLRKLDKF